MANGEKQKFVVYKATIMPKDGEKKRHGDIVELDAEDARRYNSLGYLRPYVEDEYDEADYAGAQNITRSTTSMAGAVEGDQEEVSEVDTLAEADPGTKSKTTKPEVRGDKRGHPAPMTGTEARATRNPVDQNDQDGRAAARDNRRGDGDNTDGDNTNTRRTRRANR